MADTTTINETTRNPLDGTEFIRLATTGANWKAKVQQPAGSVAWPFGAIAGGTSATSSLVLESTTGAGNGTDLISFRCGSQVEMMQITGNHEVTVDYSGTSAGNVGVAGLGAAFQVLADSGVIWNSAWTQYGADSSGVEIAINKTRSTTPGGHTTVNVNDELLAYFIYADDGTTAREAAQLSALVDGTPANSTVPGRFEFSTTPAGTSQVPVLRLRIDSTGLSSFTGPFGYGAASLGTGGTVTQATSRTTGVTLSKICGAITLFTAAPGAVNTFTTFTVTNTTVAATDTIIVNVGSGTNASNRYIANVSAVAAGSFNITVQVALSSANTDAPVINFAVIKAVTS